MEHILSGELLHFADGLLIKFFHEHRCGCLADAAAVPIKVDFLQRALVVDGETHDHSIPTERIITLKAMRAVRTFALMVGVFVMPQDVLLVKFFFVQCHCGPRHIALLVPHPPWGKDTPTTAAL